MSLQKYRISIDGTHHLIDTIPAYPSRYYSVLSFHEPGLAAAQDASGSFHIKVDGREAYQNRFLRTFGFYEGRAAVRASAGWYHILPEGNGLYKQRFAWCGNYQESFAVVKDFEDNFSHINLSGDEAYNHKFCYAGDFKGGFAVIQNVKGLYTHIDAQGHFLHNRWFLDLDVYHKGFARAKDSSGWFHIDIQGNPIYQNRYSMVEPFYNGVARVETEAGELLLISENGETLQILRLPQKDPFYEASGELVSYWRFYSLQAAIQIDLFDHLPASTEQLLLRLPIPEISLCRLLKALQEIGVIKKKKESWFLTSKGAFFQSHHPESLRHAATLWREEHLEAWKEILYSLKTNRPAFDHLFGKNWFQWLEDHPQKRKLYHQTVSTYARRDYQLFCSKIDLKEHASILDVGGSSGALLFSILEQHPHLVGSILDLPNVISLISVPETLQNRVSLIPLNFLETLPSLQYDAIILSRILHDWANPEALKILTNTRAALSSKPTARLYIIEKILQEDEGNGGLLDLNMQVMTGGTERTLGEFENLLNSTGFTLDQAIPLSQVSSILITKKMEC
jgi:hypothetical protein